MGLMAAAYPIIATVAVNALTKKPSTPAPPPPTVTPPTAMPTPGDASATAAKRQSLMEQMARQGRASTILTDQPSAKLGG